MKNLISFFIIFVSCSPAFAMEEKKESLPDSYVCIKEFEEISEPLGLYIKNKLLISNNLLGTVLCRNIETGDIVTVIPDETTDFEGGSRNFCILQNYIISANNSTMIHRINIETGADEFIANYPGIVQCLRENSKNSTQFFTGNSTGDIELWDMQSQENPIAVFKGHETPVTDLQQMGDNTLVSSDIAGTLCIWDIGQKSAINIFKNNNFKESKAKNTNTLTPQQTKISALAVVLNTLFSADNDGILRVWDLDRQSSQIIGNTNPEVSALACNNRFLFSGSLANPTIQIWSAEKKCFMGSFQASQTAINDIVTQGDMICSCGDSFIKIWQPMDKTKL